MRLFMLDMDISSFVMKRHPVRVIERLAQTRIGDVCISVVTKAELHYGVAISPSRARDQLALDAYLLHVEVVELAETVSLDYAEIRADLKLRGLMIGANDLWIAAHARSLGLTLVTNNEREFGRVKGLAMENWAALV